MSTSSNHPWTLSSPGVYALTHDSFGQVFANWVTGEAETERTTWIVVSVVKIKPQFRHSSDPHLSRPIENIDMESRLRQAWVAMRHDHPGLAAEFGSHSNVYRIPSPEGLTAWLDETFLVNPDLDARGLTRSLNRESRPRLHWLPTTSEVVLTMHHCYIDARSSWIFWTTFLDKVVQSWPGIPISGEGNNRGLLRPTMTNDEPRRPNLPPTRDDLLGLPAWPTIQGWLKAHDLVVSAMKSDMVLLPPSVPLPKTDGPKDWPAGPGSYVRLSISERQTAGVVAACKKKGITVSAAFYAALASATRAIQGTAPEGAGAGGYAVSFHNFDVRPWLHPKADSESSGYSSGDPQLPPADTNYGLGVDYHVLVPFALDMTVQGGTTGIGGAPLERSLGELARDMNQFFRSTRRDFGQDPTGLDALTHYFRSLLAPATPAPNAPIFSSLGVAEDFIRRSYQGGEDGDGYSMELEVEDTFVLTSGAKLLNCMMFHTSRGRMCALGNFDESYFHAEVLEGLVHGTFARLLAWLGIE